MSFCYSPRLAVSVAFLFALIVPANAMQIFAKIEDGSTVALEVEANDTIENIKSKISEKTDTPANEIKISYSGTELEDGKTLADYNIQKNSIVEAAFLPLNSLDISEDTKALRLIVETEVRSNLRYQMETTTNLVTEASQQLLTVSDPQSGALETTSNAEQQTKAGKQILGAFSQSRPWEAVNVFTTGSYDLEDTSTGTLSGRFSISTGLEKQISDTEVLALFTTADGSLSKIDEDLRGQASHVGLLVGAYGAKRLSSRISIGGFGAFGSDYGHFNLHNAKLSTDDNLLTAKYLFGINLSGRWDMPFVSFRPEASLSSGTEDLKDVDYESLADDSSGTQSLTAVHLTRLQFSPELRFGMPRDPLALRNSRYFFVTPNAICESTHSGRDSFDCGAGLSTGVSLPFAEGLGSLSTKFSYEAVGATERTSGRLTISRRF